MAIVITSVTSLCCSEFLQNLYLKWRDCIYFSFYFREPSLGTRIFVKLNSRDQRQTFWGHQVGQKVQVQEERANMSKFLVCFCLKAAESWSKLNRKLTGWGWKYDEQRFYDFEKSYHSMILMVTSGRDKTTSGSNKGKFRFW